MGYSLGVDVGTTYTAVAISRAGRAEIAPLGPRGWSVPSVVYLGADHSVLVGDAALRRAGTEPLRVAREFKRRIGDSVPLMVGGAPVSADALTGHLLRDVVDQVTTLQGGPPDHAVVTHPANWGPFKIECLWQAIRMSGLDQLCPTSLISEPEAAAAHYASTERLAAGETIAVYDLGGGTFDASVLRKTGSGWEFLAPADGIERLGGIDFDQAVLSHVDAAVDGRVQALDPADTSAMASLLQLRRDCVDAKEALSTDVDVIIPVALPGYRDQVRLTRAEFESMVESSLRLSVETLERVLRSARLDPGSLRAVLLVGGSSRIPLVSQVVSQAMQTAVAVDTHPKHAVALGAAATGEHRAAATAEHRAAATAAHRAAGAAEHRAAATAEPRAATEPRAAGSGGTGPPVERAASAPTERIAAPPDLRAPSTRSADPRGAPDVPAPGTGVSSSGSVPADSAVGGPSEPPQAPVSSGTGRAARRGAGSGSAPAGRRFGGRRGVLTLTAVAAVVAVLVAGGIFIAVNRQASSVGVAQIASDSSASGSNGATASETPSPNGGGGQVLFETQRGEAERSIWAATLDGAGERAVIESPAPQADGHPTFSATGMLAYLHRPDADDENWELIVAAPDGSGGRVLAEGVGRNSRPSWSPDQTKIVMPLAGRGGKTDLWIIDVPTGDREQLTSTGEQEVDPDWSPDGSKIAFRRDLPPLGDAEIFVMGLASGKETRLTNHPGYDSDPHFSPDGTTMLLTREFSGGNIEVATMSATDGDAGPVVNLTNHPGRDQDPVWHPNGFSIVWQSDRDAGDTEIYWMRADGSGVQRLTNHPGPDGVPDVRAL